MTKRLRILGIDPGSRRTGFGVVDLDHDRMSYVASGSVRSVDGDFAGRLKLIYESVSNLVGEYRPDILAIESVFVHKNPQSALKLGHARAAAMCASFTGDIEIVEYAPREIKQAIVGTGSAGKEQVQHMIVSLLRLDGAPAPDAADALAAALCHAHRRRTDGLLAGAAAATVRQR